MSKETDYLQNAREIWPMYRDLSGADFDAELWAHVAVVLDYARHHRLDAVQAACQLSLELAGDDPAPSTVCVVGWIALAALEIYETCRRPNSGPSLLLADILAAPYWLLFKEPAYASAYRNN